MLIFIFSSLWFRHSSFDMSLSFPGPETPTCEAYTFRAKPATSLVPHLWGRPHHLSPPCDHPPPPPTQSLPLGFWGLFSPGKMVPCALVKSTSLLVHVVCLQKKRKLESGLLQPVGGARSARPHCARMSISAQRRSAVLSFVTQRAEIQRGSRLHGGGKDWDQGWRVVGYRWGLPLNLVGDKA